MNKNLKKRGKSIARRLNAALTRRSFAKTVLIDFLAALMVLFTWCLTVEGASGGSLSNVSSRRFVYDSRFNIVYNTMDFFSDVTDYIGAIVHGFRPEYDIVLPFDGVSYNFDIKTNRVYSDEGIPADESAVETTQPYAETAPVEVTDYEETEFVHKNPEVYAESETAIPAITEVPEIADIPADEVPQNIKVVDQYRITENVHYTADASWILTAVSLGFAALFILQALTAIIRGFLGGGLIKQYLRPIDDIAMMAEQLSSESYSYRDDMYTTESAANEANDAGQSETYFDIKDVENLTDAIDGIADSRARIEVQASELGGLEAAINNMLKRLEESRRGQIRFVDDASHELRTPIAVIQGYANMLDRWGKEDPEIRDEAIAAIKNESEHIKVLLDQLLFLARGEMDRHVFEPVSLSADLLLCEVVEESKMLDDKHVYEIISADKGEKREIFVTADYSMLKQCIRILCDNSAKYTPDGGTINLKAEERVSADENGDVRKEVCIEVADNGIGISAEELPRIFDRFFRSEKVRADNTSGSGLGLSIARWIAEQHKGRIEAISSPGIGTKMTVIIPVI